ncbi:MAG: SDR family oxidoreductase [Rhodospirillales bacterium]|jgi:NAD(P)-dependent dehydrogenase (short-subunit alcohol dehydrogenase family)|nr:SDR family oxidoreductase [Rhodospirillales bacterium]MDP6644666.1 SDR family oxidoreductase [Rhodospirillales bacterium]MDP6842241.1 SDR family oxidoreductase [Rhodospirillales bacterium]
MTDNNSSTGMMRGKVVVVTGGGRGIGREVALKMAEAGAKVMVNDLGADLDGGGADQGPAHGVANEIVAAGGEANFNTDDISAGTGAADLIAATVEEFGRIDAVVNNAGILRDAIFHKMDEAAWNAVIQVNLNGCYHVARAAAPHFRDQESGAFVHMTSVSGLIGNFGQANYAAAKMGVAGLSRSIAIDMARYKVRSNCLSPSGFTRMIGSIPITSDEQAQAFEQLKEKMRPEMNAPLAVFLASDAAKDITGQIFATSGNNYYLFSQPRPVVSEFRDNWTPELVADEFLKEIGDKLTPLETLKDVLD